MNNSKNNGTMDNGQWNNGQGTRDKKQRTRNNGKGTIRQKESNLKGTMEGLEIWYVTATAVSIERQEKGERHRQEQQCPIA